MADVGIRFTAETAKAVDGMRAVDRAVQAIGKSAEQTSRQLARMKMLEEAAGERRQRGQQRAGIIDEARRMMEQMRGAGARAAELARYQGGGARIQGPGEGAGGRIAGLLGMASYLPGAGGQLAGGASALMGGIGGMAAVAGGITAGAGALVGGAYYAVNEYQKQTAALNELKSATGQAGVVFSDARKEAEGLRRELGLGVEVAIQAEAATISMLDAINTKSQGTAVAVKEAANALAKMGKGASEIPSLMGKIEKGGDIFGDIGATRIGGTEVRNNDQLYKAYAANVLQVRRELTELEKTEARRLALMSASVGATGEYEKSMQTVSKQAATLGGTISGIAASMADAADHSKTLITVVGALNDALQGLADSGIGSVVSGMATFVSYVDPFSTAVRAYATARDYFAGAPSEQEVKRRQEVEAELKKLSVEQQEKELKRKADEKAAREFAFRNSYESGVDAYKRTGLDIADRAGYLHADPFAGYDEPRVKAMIEARNAQLRGGRDSALGTFQGLASEAGGIYGNILSGRQQLAQLGLAPARAAQTGRYGAVDVTDAEGRTTRFAKGRYGQQTDQILSQGSAAETLTADKQFDEVLKADTELRSHMDKLIDKGPADLRGDLKQIAETERLSALRGQLGGIDTATLSRDRLDQLKKVIEDYNLAQAERLVKQFELQVRMAKDLEKLRKKLADETPELPPYTHVTITDNTSAVVKVVRPTFYETANGLAMVQ